MVHWAQLVRTSEFKMHDYGFFGNEDRYGQRQPPHYNLTAIVPSTLPIGLWYGERDSLVHPRDVEVNFFFFRFLLSLSSINSSFFCFSFFSNRI